MGKKDDVLKAFKERLEIVVNDILSMIELYENVNISSEKAKLKVQSDIVTTTIGIEFKYLIDLNCFLSETKVIDLDSCMKNCVMVNRYHEELLKKNSDIYLAKVRFLDGE